MATSAFLLLPNIIEYARIALLLVCFGPVPVTPATFFGLYVAQMLLDGEFSAAMHCSRI